MSKTTFEFNPGGTPCPVCNNGTIKEACLVPIIGEKPNDAVPAVQVHVDCLIKHTQYLPHSDMLVTPCYYYDRPKPKEDETAK